MRYFITSVSEPEQQMPQFSYVGYVDDEEFVFYNTSTKKYLPKVPWISKVEKDDPHYWLRNSHYAEGHEQSFQDHLVTLAGYYNQSRGVHNFQWIYGCELRKDGRKGGYYKYAYDGRDYISFDKENLTWMAADVQAQKTKRKWDADSLGNEFKKIYLEEICIEWLQRFLNYGKERLLRTEVPEVKVTRKAGYDGMETLICQVGGFYPKDIDIDWTKDGEVWTQDTFHGLVSPNSDGTYYTWRSIMVDPKERELYKCHVEHDGLLKPVDMAWEEPAANLELIFLCLFPCVFMVVGIPLLVVILRKCHKSKAAEGTAATSTDDGSGPSLAHTTNMANSEYHQVLNDTHPQPESTVNPSTHGSGLNLAQRPNILANFEPLQSLRVIDQRCWEL